VTACPGCGHEHRPPKPNPTEALRAIALAKAFDEMDLAAVIELSPTDLADARSVSVLLCALANATLQLLADATGRDRDDLRDEIRARVIGQAAS
jgi:hypothetical protein